MPLDGNWGDAGPAPPLHGQGVLPAAPGEWALDSCRVPGADAALALDGAQHVRPCPLGHPVPDERLTRCHRMSEPACCPFPAR